jgi:2-polyprenyl-3-methyl-5-hydroxy-6-metoxy-1,4-benzoquinol methylase
MDPTTNPWDDDAEEFARWIAEREPVRIEDNDFLSRLVELFGDLDGRAVLDAGCGEGFFSRILAACGARVVGIDLSPRLIAIARAKDPDGAIDYHVGDLSRPLPEMEGCFDLVASYLSLNDVADCRGFASTLTSLAKPGA